MSYFDNLRTFVRIYELGSMSAAARDQRISPAVTSARISQLESHLGVRLFQRTTRSLTPTEQGRIFYDGACAVLEAVEAAEAGVGDATENPRGTLHIAAPLGVGRRLIAPHVPEFTREFPLVDVRLRMTDRKIDLTAEGLDIAFFLGRPEDSNLRIRKIADCERVLCAAPFLHCRDMVIPRQVPRLIAASTIVSTSAFPVHVNSNGSFPPPMGPASSMSKDGSSVTTAMFSPIGPCKALASLCAPSSRSRNIWSLALWSRVSRTPLPCLCKWRVLYAPPPSGPQGAFVYGIYD